MQHTVRPNEKIDDYIKSLTDWRGRMLEKIRKNILDDAPELIEEWKWETPVWTYKGNVVSCGIFKDHVKISFFKGATLPDPNKLFNAGFEAKATRGIDLYENDSFDSNSFKDLIRSAIELNAAKK